MNLGQLVGKLLYYGKKYLPEILVASGTAGTVVAGVMACKATLKAKNIISEHKNYISDIDLTKKFKKESYDDADYKNDKKIIRIHETKELVKVYAPSVLVELASIALIGGGTGIMRKRFSGVSALAASLGTAIIDYRNRVSDKIGADEEEKLYLGVQEETVSEKITDENGKTKTVKKKITKGMDPVSKYYIKLDDSWGFWEPDRQRVVYKILAILKNINEYFYKKYGWYSYNQLCKAYYCHEHICPEGQDLVWIWKEGISDEENEIKFIGIENQFEQFLSGKQDYILLNPNFDGPFKNLIPSGKKFFTEEYADAEPDDYVSLNGQE